MYKLYIVLLYIALYFFTVGGRGQGKQALPFMVGAQRVGSPHLRILPTYYHLHILTWLNPSKDLPISDFYLILLQMQQESHAFITSY